MSRDGRKPAPGDGKLPLDANGVPKVSVPPAGPEIPAGSGPAPVDPAAAARALAELERDMKADAGDRITPETLPAIQAVPASLDAHTVPEIPSARAGTKPTITGGATMKPLETPVSAVPVVQFVNVTKRYEQDGKQFTAIKDVSFSIPDYPGRGEFIGILGPSGCGKSTVIRLIAGLAPQFPQTSGQVLIDGKKILGPGADRGMVFQDYTSFDNRTVLENIAFGLECRGVPKKERVERALHWVDKVGLSTRTDADKFPHELSGGMRQRVAIARTLILEPRIILMDEPFGALDPPTRTRMQDNLVKLWREQSPTVFFITHSIEEAVYLGDHVLIFSSSPGTVLKELRLPPPDRPALEAQRDPKFQDIVFGIRDIIEKLESSSRGGD